MRAVTKFMVCGWLLIALLSCRAKTNDNIGIDADYADLVNTVYEKFVFAIDADPDVYDKPENFFTASALKKLSEGTESDCHDGSCYAYNALRTKEQDAKPGSDGESQVCSVESVGDGWYIVTYSDMGWSGMTRIKIVDGKIDDYERCVADL